MQRHTIVGHDEVPRDQRVLGDVHIQLPCQEHLTTVWGLAWASHFGPFSFVALIQSPADASVHNRGSD